jgi:hypothetical protein
MRRVRLTLDAPTDGPAGEYAGEGRATKSSAHTQMVKGLAAFLLGLTLGISGIILGQTAIQDEPTSDALPLRR